MLAKLLLSLDVNIFTSLLFTNAPKLIKPVFKRIPFTVQEKLLLPILGKVFNEVIKDGDFDFLRGNWLRISITDLGLEWLLSYKNEQLIMTQANSGISEDVSFSAGGDDLLLIAGRKEDPDTLFFQRRLKIEGDTELGLEVKNLIDAIDLEELPKMIHKSVDYLATQVEKHKPD